MKHKFKTLRGNFIAVPISNDSYRFSLVKNKLLKNRYGNLEWTERKKGTERICSIENIEHAEIVGSYPDDFTEKLAHETIGIPVFGHYKNFVPTQSNYSDLWTKTALESLNSKMLFEHLYLENPLGNVPGINWHSEDEAEESIRLWTEAQKRTSTKWLIIKVK